MIEIRKAQPRVQAPFRVVARIPPYRKRSEWNKRLRVMIFGCQRTPDGSHECLMKIMFHFDISRRRFFLSWHGGGTRRSRYQVWVADVPFKVVGE